MITKNRIKKTIAASFLCISLVSNHFVAFAEDSDLNPPIETIEEIQEDAEAAVEESLDEPIEEIEEIVKSESEEEIEVDETIEEEEENEIEEPIIEIVEEEPPIAPEIPSMPAFSYSTNKDGMSVSISANEGIFPEGTTVSISVLGDDSAQAIAETALGTDNVKQAKAVDITFYDKNGTEIQPTSNVNISISFDAIDGDNFTVLHDHNGSISPIDATVNADSASFSINEFSVFIVVGTEDDEETPIATYRFLTYENDTWITYAEQYLKSGDNLTDPGTPSIDPDKNEEFLGWYYKESDTPVTFDTIDNVTIGDVIEIYANITTTYYVTFVGIDNDVVQVKKIAGTQGESAYTTVNDIPYAVQKSTQAFKGWTTTQNDESTLITNNNIDASKVSHVYAYVIDAFWIHFDENDDLYDTNGNKISSGGASYIGPVAVSQTQTPAQAVSTIPESTRRGYDFLGWYYGTKGSDNNVTLGEPFDWNTLMTEDVTVYAKWEAHANTELTINIWKQNLEGTGYDYVADASRTYEGVTGATLECHENYFYMSDPAGNYDYYSSSDIDLTGFEYNSAKIVDSTGKEVSTLSAKGDTVINVFYNRKTYTLTFQDRVNNRWTTVYTINALYEQNISSYFPIKVGNTTYNNFWQVQGNPSTYVHDLLVGKIDIMPAENITFHKYTVIGRTFDATWNYYVEALENATDTISYDNIDFILRNAIVLTVTGDMQSTEAEEFMNIRGFTKYKADPAYKNGVQSIVQNRPINLYYLRNKYSLTFMDGNNSIKTIAQIPYEQSLSSYESQAPTMNDKDGTRFVGWYLDKSCTIPFDWNTTMPIDGQIVYAKYAPIRFQVTLDPAGGVIDTTKQADSFMEDYNGKLDANSMTLNISKEDWELVGWFYKDGPKAGQAYDFDKITETTTDYTYNEEKGYFVGTVNLIAGWRFPGVVHIRYDAGENGTDAPTADQYGYAYNSTVVVDRPSKPNKDYSFIGWTIKNDSSNTVYYPNSSFAIDKDYAETIDGTEYITLIAKYEKTSGSGSSNALVDITYHSNDEEDITYIVEGIKVNKPIDAATLEEAFGEGYTRPRYIFLGWSKTEGDDNEVWLKAGTAYTIAADEEPTNDLYAVWEEEPMQEVTYTVQHVIDGEVMDEDTYSEDIPASAPAKIEIYENSLEPYEYEGYKFKSISPKVKEGQFVDSGTIITLTYVKDPKQTKELTYYVDHDVDGEIMDEIEVTQSVWINDEDELTVTAKSIAQKKYKGYIFDSIDPEDIKAGDKIEDGATITLYYIIDETATKTLTYTVNHIIDGKVKDTVKVTEEVWVNEEDEIQVTEESIDPNDYPGYEYSTTVDAKTEEEIEAWQGVPNKTVINVLYEPKTIKVRYEYRFANENEKPDTLPELPAPFESKYGEEIELIDLPVIEGYTLTDWAFEEDLANGTIGTFSRSISAPNYNIVIYTIISKNKVDPEPEPDPTPPKPKPKKDEDHHTEIHEEDTPLAAAPVIIPAPAIEQPITILPRHGQTSDNYYITIIKRYSIIILSLTVIALLLIVDYSKKRKS